MSKFRGKRYLESLKALDKEKKYDLSEALEVLMSFKKAKFDESVELHFHLGIDPKKSDQQIRSSLVLPNGTGKKVTILVFAEGEKAQEAKDAGADFVGVQEYIDKIQKEGWTDFDVTISTPNLMRHIGKIARILGPRGLMPNPKVGTVTNDIKKAVELVKAGKVTYRADKLANIHFIVGKKSFSMDNLKENILVSVAKILKDRPSSLKGQFIKSISICSTISPGVNLDISSVANQSKEGER